MPANNVIMSNLPAPVNVDGKIKFENVPTVGGVITTYDDATPTPGYCQIGAIGAGVVLVVEGTTYIDLNQNFYGNFWGNAARFDGTTVIDGVTGNYMYPDGSIAINAAAKQFNGNVLGFVDVTPSGASNECANFPSSALAPVTPGTIAGWILIKVDGSPNRYIPFYV